MPLCKKETAAPREEEGRRRSFQHLNHREEEKGPAAFGSSFSAGIGCGDIREEEDVTA